MTRIIDQVVLAYPNGRLEQLNDGVVHLANPAVSEAAALLRHFADLIENGHIDAQRLTMAPRGQRGRLAYQSMTLWFSSVEPAPRPASGAPLPAFDDSE
jgi:hypothetical protein